MIWKLRASCQLFLDVLHQHDRATLLLAQTGDAVVRSKTIDLALGVLREGTLGVPGPWIKNTEGARFSRVRHQPP